LGFASEGGNRIQRVMHHRCSQERRSRDSLVEKSQCHIRELRQERLIYIKI